MKTHQNNIIKIVNALIFYYLSLNQVLDSTNLALFLLVIHCIYYQLIFFLFLFGVDQLFNVQVHVRFNFLGVTDIVQNCVFMFYLLNTNILHQAKSLNDLSDFFGTFDHNDSPLVCIPRDQFFSLHCFYFLWGRTLLWNHLA